MAEDEKKKDKKPFLTRLREKIRAKLLSGEGTGKTVGTAAKQLEEMGLLSEEEQARIDAERERKKRIAEQKRKNK